MSLRTRIRESGEFVRIALSTDLSGSARKDLPEGLLDEFGRDPERYFDPGSGRSIKNGSKTQLARATLRSPRGAELDVVIKKFRHRFPRRLGFFVAPSPALRSLAGALLLRRKGFHTPAPVAVLDRRGWRHTGTSYYIAEDLKDSSTLRELWRGGFSSQPPMRRFRLGRAVVGDLARLLYRLHAEGLYHHDLKGSNILICDWDMDRRRFYIVDLDRVQERRRIPLSKRIKNLLQVRSGMWSPRERILFFRKYVELIGIPKAEGKQLIRDLLVARLKRRV